MADAKPVAILAMDMTARTGTIYPPEFAGEMKGREKRALGDAFGLSQFGVNLTVLKPGAWSSHRHWHAVEDEFIYVISGEITLVDDAGEHLLTPGMCAGFKAGVPNGHCLKNLSSQEATYLEVGTRSMVEKSNYPDIDMAGEKTEASGGKFVLTRKDGTPF